MQGPWRSAWSLVRLLHLSHVATIYVAEATNPIFDIWRSNFPWLGKEWGKKLYTNTWGKKGTPYILYQW